MTGVPGCYESLHKEQFSTAYVRAVVAAAGYSANRIDPDTHSADLQIGTLAAGQLPRDPKLEVQIKGTSVPCYSPDGALISFKLKRKNYDDLRAHVLVPRVLIVVVLPQDSTKWVAQTCAALALMCCGYWASLAGEEDSDPKRRTITVQVPCAQVFSVEALKRMMRNVSDDKGVADEA